MLNQRVARFLKMEDVYQIEKSDLSLFGIKKANRGFISRGRQDNIAPILFDVLSNIIVAF